MARRRSGKKIDFVHWTGIQESALALAAGTVGMTALAAQHDPETWLRFRGNLLSFVDGNQTPNRLAQVAVGLILVPEGTGTTVLWSPASDPDAPWMFYDIFVLGYEESVVDVIDQPGLVTYRSTIDSKSMRIIRNQEVQFVVENVTIGTAVTINTVLTGRVLSGT